MVKWNIKRWNDCRTPDCKNRIEYVVSDKYCIHCAPGLMIVKRFKVWRKQSQAFKYISAKIEIVKLFFENLKDKS